ncbi:MoxR family ATPase [Adlercreutzia sp. R21]|uniref:ATP-binding protein n=1 Tax=Adlercreutzia wanghongyangiae TaxID=3111451 RepID=UPI002DBA007E|nr:MoxR family ATPase [Adlercreutzia sp. R21]MEC4183405.1 MoxR family ATPase [Adlercreutzia sp. R21]
MDIATAINQVRNTVKAYLATDEYGLRRISTEMQRPIILMGPPGVGKTAIVAQVAEEMGINFVSYSITHHTRQSALGLPFISEKVYGGRLYKVSEYTMSEIIGATYEAVESSGVAEGIIFLDEVNCVSETLAPAMLQFLQFKTFGQHRLPEGWIVVAAGNPPEFNETAREFDAALLDRLKCLSIEPSVDAWRAYAVSKGAHSAVVGYLECWPNHFYKLRMEATEKCLVTARGWMELSRVLQTYEAENLEIDRDLIGQYLQDDEIATSFAVYYELFQKYKKNYPIAEILEGDVSDEVIGRARKSSFDERIAVLSLLLEALQPVVHAFMYREEALKIVRDFLIEQRDKDAGNMKLPLEIEEFCEWMRGKASRKRKLIGDKDVIEMEAVAITREILGDGAIAPEALTDREERFGVIRNSFNTICVQHGDEATGVSLRVDAALGFLEKAFGVEQETLIAVTRLSADPVFVSFVGQYGSGRYFEQSKQLLFEERSASLLREIEALDESLPDARRQ